MSFSLQQLQRQSGAIFGHFSTPESWTQSVFDPQSLTTQVYLYDQSHWGVLRLTGEDRLRYLHNQSTNTFQLRQTGEVCDTVLVTSTARTLDLATVYVTDQALILVVSPQRCNYLLNWFDRFIFPMDKVEIKDCSQDYSIFTLLGATSDTVLKTLGIEPPTNSDSYQNINLDSLTFQLSKRTGLDLEGYTFLIPRADSATLWQKIANTGVQFLGNQDWEKLRVLQGRPYPDHELTEDYNPLEAGLWRALSFNKGCYIGQETIARLNTYKGVKQRLFGIDFASPVSEGAVIFLGEEKIGLVTSVTQLNDRYRALGYIRTKAGGEGLTVTAETATGTVIPTRFLSHNYHE